MQQNNGMSRAAAMAYRVLIRRGVSALPVHPLEILSACRNTVVWADVTAAEQLKIPREALLRQLANAEAITFRQTIQGETRFIVVYREGGNPARFPNVVTASEATVGLVDRRWTEYGLGAFVESPSRRYRRLLLSGGAQW